MTTTQLAMLVATCVTTSGATAQGSGADVQGGTVPVLLICNACLQASDIGVRQEQGPVAPLTTTSLRGQEEPGVFAGFVKHYDARGRLLEGLHTAPAKVFTAAHAGQPVIEWNPKLKPAQYLTLGELSKKETKFTLLPAVVQVGQQGSWAPFVHNSHVCLGSTFEVPTFYFLGPGDKPMASVPIKLEGVSAPGIDADFRSLPARPSQTVCSGELRPVQKFLTEWALEQVKVARDEATTAYGKEAADAAARKAAIDWLNQHQHELLARLKGMP